MERGLRIFLLCSLIGAIAWTGTLHAPAFLGDLIAKIKAKIEAKKEEKVTISKLARLISDSKDKSHAFEADISAQLGDSFMESFFLEWFIKEEIKEKMRRHEENYSKKIKKTIDSAETIEPAETESLKIKSEYQFYVSHYSIVDILIDSEEYIFKMFNWLHPVMVNLYALSLSGEITRAIEVIDREGTGDFRGVLQKSEFTKRVHDAYEMFRLRITNMVSGSLFKKFMSRLLTHLDQRFFVRYRDEKTGIYKKRANDNLASHLPSAIPQDLRGAMFQYITAYLINGHILDVLENILKMLTNNLYDLNNNFNAIENWTGRGYDRFFNSYVDHLSMVLLPEAEQAYIREQQRIAEWSAWRAEQEAKKQQPAAAQPGIEGRVR